MIAITLLLTIFLVSAHHVSSQDSLKTEFTYTLDESYPMSKNLFGNIAGVDVDSHNNVIIFHRGSHKWDLSTFNNDIYQPSKDSPIREETVVTIDPIEKKIIGSWGSNIFFMPHGLSLDYEGKNLWLTDVALHQVFKYPINGSQMLLSLGTSFVPGNDESHFCKPTSVADTGEFIFVADGYCNSRIAMFSSDGKYIGEFGQSSEAPYSLSKQPRFQIPHKITYAKEAGMLCVADRENGRIQCFSFEPRYNSRTTQDDTGLILNQAINLKFIIADPLFNGRLFAIDYSPVAGGIIVAVSGEPLYSIRSKPPLGFVYNATTGQLISQFAPPPGRQFGMAHDLAVTNDEAGSLYVVDITPINLWKFSRPVKHHKILQVAELTKVAGAGFDRAMSLVRENEHNYGFLWYILMIIIVAAILFIIVKAKRDSRPNAFNSFGSLYSSSQPASFNNLFGHNRFGLVRRPNGRPTLATMFSRSAFYNLFDRTPQQQNDFSRVPLEDSDNSDVDKSDSDVEEFNINQATQSIKIDV